MSPLTDLFDSPLTVRFAWMLLHFVWQGALVGLAAVIVLTGLRRAAPQVRYGALLSLFGLMAVSPVITLVSQPMTVSNTDQGPVDIVMNEVEQTLSAPVVEQAAVAAESSVAVHSTSPELAESNIAGSSETPGDQGHGAIGHTHETSSTTFGIPSIGAGVVLSWTAVGWLVGVVLLSLRLALGLAGIERLKRQGVQPASQLVCQMAARLGEQLRISAPVRVLESTYTTVPVLMGWLKPVILLPPAALTGLSTSQLAAILAHELAHIRRHDYLVNVLQTIVETLLFYHPVVWWLSSRLRHEREDCCDDLAAAICGDRIAYARALTSLENLRGPAVPLAVAASGSSLLRRIRRLVKSPPSVDNHTSGWLAGVIVLTAVGLLGLSMHATLQATEATEGSVSTLEIEMPYGTVEVTVYDSKVRVDLESDTETLVVTGAGAQVVRMRPRPEQFPDSADKTLEWFSITRVGKPVVQFRLRGSRVLIDLERIRSLNVGGGFDVALSPDGNRALVGGNLTQRQFLIWNTKTGETIRQIGTGGTAPLFVAFVADGRQGVVASITGRAELWDLEKAERIRTFQHAGGLTAIALSPDGQRLATGGLDKSIRIWNVGSGDELLRIRGHEDMVTRVAFLPRGRQIVSASMDKTVRIWDAETGQEIRRLNHPEPVWCMAVSPDGRRLLSGVGGRIVGPLSSQNLTQGEDNSLFLWDSATGKLIHKMYGHQNTVRGVAFSPDGRLAISASIDKTFRLWGIEQGRELKRVYSKGWLAPVAFSPDGRHVLVGGVGQKLAPRRWLHAEGERVRWFRLTHRNPEVAEAAPQRVDTVRVESRVRPPGPVRADVKRPSVGQPRPPSLSELIKRMARERGRPKNESPVIKEIRRFDKGSSVYSVAFLSGGDMALAGGDAGDGRTLLWNTKTGEANYLKPGDSGTVVAASLNGGRYAMVSVSDPTGTIKFGDRMSRQLSHGAMVLSLAFSSEGEFLASGARDGSIKIWNLETGERVFTLEGHTDGVMRVAFVPEGNRLVSGSLDKTLRVWDLQDGSEQRVMEHPAPVWSMAVAPVTWLVVTGTGGELFDDAGRPHFGRGTDNRIRGWNIGTGAFVGDVRGHENSVADLVFTPDGQRLISASLDGTLRVWQIEQRRELAQIKSKSWVTAVAVSPDGRHILAGGGVYREDDHWVHVRDERLRLFELSQDVPFKSSPYE